jgi:hypothetical protein
MPALSLLDVLIAEHEAIRGPFPAGRPASLEALWTEIHREARGGATGRAALCLSGGGIRSATFALGVLQGLAERRLLGKFDYLSTVSGGGYVGAWLSAWIQRRNGQLDDVEEALAGDAERAATRARDLNPDEPLAVRHLREYSNYLTPHLGFLSADTWTLVGTYLRNLSLNWLALVPLLAAVLMLPRVFHAVIAVEVDREWARTLAGVGLALLAWSVISMARWRPSLYEHHPISPPPTEARFLRHSLLPLLAGAVVVTVAWAWLEAGSHGRYAVREAVEAIPFVRRLSEPLAAYVDSLLVSLLIVGVLAHVFAWAFYTVRHRVVARKTPDGWGWEGVCAAIAGALAGAGTWALVTWTVSPFTHHTPARLYTVLALPAFIGVLLAATTMFVGMMSRYTDDEDREWWARYGGWVLAVVLGWTGMATLVLYGPHLIERAWTLATVTGVSGMWALIVGWSGLTAAGDKGGSRQSLKQTIVSAVLNQMTTLAALVFILGFVALLSLAVSLLLGWVWGVSPATDHLAVLRETPWWVVLGTMGALATLALAASAFLHVNKFSLHAMYRSRLIRAYLGASNENRRPHPATGFDPADNVSMADLPRRPFHVVNIALNLVGGADLAWQERKAQSFTVSPLHVGSPDPRLGYRLSAEYGAGPSTAISLGTAVAISGAAVSPNMGYNSSPPVTFVLTLFNARLGWWLGNPGPAGETTYRRAGPALYFGPILSELLGLTDNQRKYVYLSDGGHFENLGLYEMVLRRCHFILVSDAGCDPEGALGDLGSAIRKIRTDLGIPITLDHAAFKIASRETATGAGRYCAIGTIGYQAVDGPQAANGTLVYLKPGFYGDEPKDIFNYATAHPAFPHESTADQWFTESQFESYRALGLYAVQRMCVDPGTPIPDLPTFADRIRRYIAA